MFPQTALKYDVQVQDNGQIGLQVPLPAGSHVTIFVIPTDNEWDDLLHASQSSTDFWDNPFDDEDWNNA